MNWRNLKGLFAFKSVSLIPLSIFAAKVLEVLFRIFDVDFTSPSNNTYWFVSNFIEWFGVLYGILLPLILVRVWEQLDEIDREFDREADTVRILYEDLSYLPERIANIRKEISKFLRQYVQHVANNYPAEIKQSGTERITGDEILLKIREQFKGLIHPDVMSTKDTEFIVKELFHGLNEIIDIRGDRIALASQRLFESLRLVALITSITFILPFYFAGLVSPTGLLDVILIIGVTLLVIFIYMIIEDLDEPFTGTWKVSVESWRRVLAEMDSDERKLELENLATEEPKKDSSPGSVGESGPVVSVPPKRRPSGKKPDKKSATLPTTDSTSSTQKRSRKIKSA